MTSNNLSNSKNKGASNNKQKSKDNYEKKKIVSNTRVEKNKELYVNDLSLTKQQKFNFESSALEDEPDTKVTKKKVNKQKNSDNKNEKKEIVIRKVYPKFLIFSLLILLLGIIFFDICYFINSNHNMENEKKLKRKIVTLQKKVEKQNINYGDIIYLGDSITEFYDLNKYYDFPIVNSGVSGWTTDDILNNLDDKVFQYEPKKVFLLIGTNDIIYNKNADYIVNNIKKIVNKIEEKVNIDIYVQSIYPINDSENNKIDHDMVKKRKNYDIKIINKKLKAYCNSNGITYIDMYNQLVDNEGNLKLEYTREGLHISDGGYAKITKILKNIILDNYGGVNYEK